MGLEHWYIPIAEDSRIIDRARVDSGYGVHLQCPSYFGPNRRRGPRSEPLLRFLDDVDAMNRRHPGIDGRIYTLDRWFDKLLFLLSPARREGQVDPLDPAWQAIEGPEALPDHLRAVQGVPLRYGSPRVVGELAAWIAEVDFASLRGYHNLQAMVDRQVYKAHAADDPQWHWGVLEEYFHGLRGFYRAATAAGNGVLYLMD